MSNRDIHSLARFFSKIDLKVICKVYRVLGFKVPKYYFEFRPGMVLVMAVDLCQRNKIKAGDFMNLFLLEINNLNLN